MKLASGRLDLGDMLPALESLFLMEKVVGGVVFIKELLFATAYDNAQNEVSL